MSADSLKMVDRAVPAESQISELIVFPSPEKTISPQPIGYVRGIALLRLLDGTLWMLEMSGRAWTPGRLRAAADRLSRLSGRAANFRRIERTLSTDLDVRSVRLREPNIDTVDLREWGVSEIAKALAGHQKATDMESQIVADLEVALRDIEGTMDPEARRLSLRGGEFDAKMRQCKMRPADMRHCRRSGRSIERYVRCSGNVQEVLR